MKRTILLVFTAIVFVTGLTIFIMNLNAKNSEVSIRNQIAAQQTDIGNYYDKMWKILKQKAGVTDQYKNAFKDIYTGLITGRYSGSSKDGSLMKLIVESNPNFDVSLYKDLMNSIEIERTGFYNEQRTLIDLNREHENLLAMAPSSWFLSSAPHVAIHLVTSDKTQSILSTGRDNDVN